MKLSRLEWSKKCDMSVFETVLKQKNIFETVVVPTLTVMSLIFSAWILHYILLHHYDLF